MATLMAVLYLLAAAGGGAPVPFEDPQQLIESAIGHANAGRAAAACDGMRRALSASAPKSADEADSLNGLAWLLMDAGETDEAERLAARALKVGEGLFGQYSPKLVVALNTLAEGRIARRDFPAAERLLRRATRLSALPGTTPLLEAAVAVRRGLLWMCMGRYHEAEPILEHSLALSEEYIGADHPALRPLLDVLARCYRLRNRPEEAAAVEARYEALGGTRHEARLAQGAR